MPSAENKLLNIIALRECNKLSEAEIMFRDCPQDNQAGHVEQINANIISGKTKLFEIIKNNSPVGFVAVEVYDRQWTIVAMHTREHISVFSSIIPIFEAEAKRIGCECVAFSTVRPGLIVESLKNHYILSEVVLRKYL